MIRRNFWNFEVEMDQEATSEWYSTNGPWGCACGDCQNFLKQARCNLLPAPVHAVLRELGIPAEKATYVCEIMPKANGHLYQFSYRIAGRILNEDAHNTVADWGEVSCCHEPYPYGAPDFPTPHFDLEFWVTLPWVPDIHG